MSDIKFPLRYDGKGSIQIVKGDPKITSQITQLINIVRGERYLFPSFGFPVQIIQRTFQPDIVTELVRLAILQIQNIDAKVDIVKYDNGRLTLSIKYSDSQIFEVFINALPASPN